METAARPGCARTRRSHLPILNSPCESWWAATVPGTALTTMVDRGIYPDPDYGLNNLAIPESLNKQDYWYRNGFESPKTATRSDSR